MHFEFRRKELKEQTINTDECTKTARYITDDKQRVKKEASLGETEQPLLIHMSHYLILRHTPHPSGRGLVNLQ